MELKAFVDILYFAGMHKLSGTNIKRLWKPYGMSIFRCAMSKNHFLFLLLCLRFDDRATREERKSQDRLAHIRETWEAFIANCTAYYEPYQNVTIDEQLLGFRSKCIFRMYIPNKPDKY